MNDLRNGPQSLFLVWSEGITNLHDKFGRFGGSETTNIDTPGIYSLEQIKTVYASETGWILDGNTFRALELADPGSTVSVESGGCGGFDLYMNHFVKLDQHGDKLIKTQDLNRKKFLVIWLDGPACSISPAICRHSNDEEYAIQSPDILTLNQILNGDAWVWEESDPDNRQILTLLPELEIGESAMHTCDHGQQSFIFVRVSDETEPTWKDKIS